MERGENLKVLMEKLRDEPVLRRADAYILVILDRARRETAFLVDAVQVKRDGLVVPLVISTQPEREVCIASTQDQENQDGCGEEDFEESEETFECWTKTEYPQAHIQNCVSYRLDRKGSKLTGFEWDDIHEWPIVYFNVGERELWVESYKVPSGNYFISTVDTPCASQRKHPGRPVGKSFQSKYVENGRKGRVDKARDGRKAYFKSFGREPERLPEDLIERPNERFYPPAEN